MAATAAPETGPPADEPPASAPPPPDTFFVPMDETGGCNVSLGSTIREFPDEEGNVDVQIDYSGAIECTPDVFFEGEAYLVDRTPGFDGTILAQAPTVDGYDGATSRGSKRIAANYIGADEVETVFAADLFSPYLWQSCKDRPGARIIRCEGVGTKHLLVVVGSGKYDSKKRRAAPCTPKNHEFLQNVRGKKGNDMATPAGAFAYCVNARGDVVSARTLGVSPGTRVSALVGMVEGDTTPRQTIVDKKKVYLVTFTMIFEFSRRFVLEGALSVIGGKMAYEAGEKCQISFVFVIKGDKVDDSTQNPCKAWNPGLISMFDVDRSVYRAGDDISYEVKGAPANAPIYWSSVRDGVPTGESLAFYGHYTDANGNWSVRTDAWPESLTGEWVKTVHVGQFYDRIAFTVQPTADPPVKLTLDKEIYRTGESPTYTVIGPPNAPIYWSSTRNGQSTGEVDSFYGQYTDQHGHFTATTPPWTTEHTGEWTKTARIGDKSSTFAFTVNN